MPDFPTFGHAESCGIDFKTTMRCAQYSWLFAWNRSRASWGSLASGRCDRAVLALEGQIGTGKYVDNMIFNYMCDSGWNMNIIQDEILKQTETKRSLIAPDENQAYQTGLWICSGYDSDSVDTEILADFLFRTDIGQCSAHAYGIWIGGKTFRDT